MKKIYLEFESVYLNAGTYKLYKTKHDLTSSNEVTKIKLINKNKYFIFQIIEQDTLHLLLSI